MAEATILASQNKTGEAADVLSRLEPLDSTEFADIAAMRTVLEWRDNYGRYHYPTGRVDLRKEPSGDAAILARLESLDALQVGPPDSRGWSVVHHVARSENGSVHTDPMPVDLSTLLSDTVGYVNFATLTTERPTVVTDSEATTGTGEVTSGVRTGDAGYAEVPVGQPVSWTALKISPPAPRHPLLSQGGAPAPPIRNSPRPPRVRRTP